MQARAALFFSVSSSLLYAPWWLMISVDGNNCNTHSINIHSIYSRDLLDACIYDQDSVDRVLYAVQHGHQVASGTWSHADLTTLYADQSQSKATRLQSLVLYFNLHNSFLQLTTRCGRSSVRVLPSYLYLSLYSWSLSFILEALLKIAGVSPAFMQPRMPLVNTIWKNSFINHHIWQHMETLMT